MEEILNELIEFTDSEDTNSNDTKINENKDLEIGTENNSPKEGNKEENIKDALITPGYCNICWNPPNNICELNCCGARPYCTNCITKWLLNNTNCPFCRKKYKISYHNNKQFLSFSEIDIEVDNSQIETSEEDVFNSEWTSQFNSEPNVPIGVRNNSSISDYYNHNNRQNRNNNNNHFLSHTRPKVVKFFWGTSSLVVFCFIFYGALGGRLT